MITGRGDSVPLTFFGLVMGDLLKVLIVNTCKNCLKSFTKSWPQTYCNDVCQMEHKQAQSAWKKKKHQLKRTIKAEKKGRGRKKRRGAGKKNRPSPSVAFYESRQWQELRYLAFKKYGRKCMCCFATNCELHCDHVKPRSLYPELALVLSNLQILCRPCNIGKSNKHEDDWRTDEQRAS